jgi:hypothetical protein
MDGVLKLLNDNAGALTAVLTVVYVAVTLAILLEARATRNLRREALVDARLMVHPPASLLLELRVRNLGPAVARDVVIEFWFTDPSGATVGERRRQGEQSLGPGDGRRFLPMAGAQLADLNSLGAANLTIHVQWRWIDDRRGVRRRPERHERELAIPAEQLGRDFFGGWALTQSDPDDDLHTIAEAIEKLERHAKAIKDRRPEI